MSILTSILSKVSGFSKLVNKSDIAGVFEALGLGSQTAQERSDFLIKYAKASSYEKPARLTVVILTGSWISLLLIFLLSLYIYIIITNNTVAINISNSVFKLLASWSWSWVSIIGLYFGSSVAHHVITSKN